MSEHATKHTLRIIAGEWRGRKIHFPANPSLRPTPDRVRETLFNWLMPVMDGARCLDLFCGSGILGLEALSRGAGQVVFVDSHRQSIQALAETCKLLGTERAQFFEVDALQYLHKPPQRFDIVFLDPPYESTELLKTSAALLQSNTWLTENTYIYVEHAPHFDPTNLPPQWQVHRQKRAGQVSYSLYTCVN